LMLAVRAAEVPAETAERLRQLDYRPRVRSWVPAVTAGLAVMTLAVSGGAYVAATAASGTGAPASHPAPARPAIALDGYQFELPAGFKPADTRCTAPGRGGSPPAPAPPGRFAAGARAHGGCMQVMLSAGHIALQRPAVPARVGPYSGFVAAQPAEHRVALYVEIPSAGRRWLVITALRLSAAQVISIAARAVGEHRHDAGSVSVKGY
jgi:hypothetical protein